MHVDHPLQVDAAGRTARTRAEAGRTPYGSHIHDLVVQVLFTNPGERVNRPDFGCGLDRLLFMPNSDVLAVATQFLVQGSLQRWLGDLIEVRGVAIEAKDSSLVVDVRYVVLADGTAHRERFVREAAP